MPDGCPFCVINSDRIWLEDAVGVVLYDAYPVSKGHTLVVPKNHVASIYGLTGADRLALWQLADYARLQLQEELHPDGFNIGVNDGTAAGQTVMHAHIHVIPRFEGDVADPKGGIRWVVSDKARYW
jgi:diadenosine tetraphosphate (Ap4A) HIT family hydrolase